jgi:uncharacterized protein
MSDRDKLDLANRNRLDLLVDYRRFLVGVIVLISVILAFFLTRLQTDPTLESGMDRTSPEYKEYQEFIKTFGDEEFILVAIRNPQGGADAVFLQNLAEITRKLERFDKIAETVSLTNLKVFQKKGDVFGNYPILGASGGKLAMPEPSRLESMRNGLPVMNLLLSADHKTVGILLRIEDRWKFDTDGTRQLVEDIRQVVKEHLQPGSEFRIVGPALIRQAVVRYNIQTGVIFGVLCTLICTVVSVYVFRSAKVTAITNVILGLCVVWVLGLMGLFGIPVNSTTVLSFGFIPITTLEIVIHMVVRYHLFHQASGEKIGAIKQAVRWLTRPCLFCTATTAVGFGTLVVSSIPMVRQLGFIMSVGVFISYCLAMILTPAFFVKMKSLDAQDATAPVRMDSMLHAIENAIFRHHKFFVFLGIFMAAILFAGTPLIRSDTQILRMFTDSTPEVQDIAFVEKNLTSVHSVSIMLEAEAGAFKKPEAWQKVMELEKRLSEIPEVVSTESLLPLLTYLYGVMGDSANPQSDIFSDPRIVPQMLSVTSLSGAGERITQRYLSQDFDKLQIVVRFKNSPNVPIGETIEKIRSAAESVTNGTARAFVTGELVVMAQQTANLIDDQIRCMFLAAILIAVLMMIQMNSFLLGLICVVPNIPPVAAVFGIMGWCGISLDNVTVFAATVAIGLAADNTIHYLTQLKREISCNPGQGIEDCVRSAYRITARQISSWTVVTLFGFLALTVSPFRPVVYFGILGCSALTLGLFGDLIFIQSLILSSSTIRNTIKRLIDREIGF